MKKIYLYVILIISNIAVSQNRTAFLFTPPNQRCDISDFLIEKNPITQNVLPFGRLISPEFRSSLRYESLGPSLFKSQMANYTLDSIIMNDSLGGVSKIEYKHDSDDNIIEYANYSWNSIINEWEGVIKYLYSYDSQGNNTLTNYYLWDNVSKKWYYYGQQKSIYNIQNQSISYISYIWDTAQAQFIDSSKVDYTYNAGGLLYILNTFISDSSGWLEITRDTLIYNSANNLISHIGYNNYTTPGTWAKYYKYEYTYNNGQNIKWTYSFWDATTNAWVEYYKWEYVYDLLGDIKSFVYKLWDNVSGQWINQSRNNYSRDGNGNILSDTIAIWDTNQNGWINSTRTDYSYDLSIDGQDIAWGFENYNNMINSSSSFDWVNGSWSSSGVNQRFYYTANNTVGLSEGSHPKITIYPNPSSTGIVFIHTENINKRVSLELLDLQGRLILKREIDSGTTALELQDKGVYCYIINYGGKVLNGKMIVR